MNYCPNCGEKLQEDGAYCPNCGASLKEDSLRVDSVKKEYVISENQAQTSNKSADPNNNYFAIVGFVLSLFSFMTCGITSLFGLVFSIIGLVNAKKHKTNGREYAIAGIIISAVFIVLLVICFISYFSLSRSLFRGYINAPHY